MITIITAAPHINRRATINPRSVYRKAQVLTTHGHPITIAHPSIHTNTATKPSSGRTCFQAMHTPSNPTMDITLDIPIEWGITRFRNHTFTPTQNPIGTTKVHHFRIDTAIGLIIHNLYHTLPPTSTLTRTKIA